MTQESIAAFKITAAKLLSEFRNEATKLLETPFKDFMLENPEVKTIRFMAFTPYFNDGEECVYRIGEFTLELHDEFRKLWLEEKFANEKFDFKYEGHEDYLKESIPDAMRARKNLREFRKSMQLNDLFKIVLGDHVKVEADLEGITVEPYTDHN